MPNLSKQEVYKNIEQAVRSVGIKTQTALGKVCGIGQGSVSKWKRGINYPEIEHMLLISAKTKYEIQWLYSREGPKIVPETGRQDVAPRLMVSLIDALRSEDEVTETARLYAIAPIGLGYLDVDLKFCYINDWLASLNGIPAADFIGKTLSEMVPHVAEGVNAVLQEVIDTGVPVINGEVRATTLAHPEKTELFRHNYYPDFDSNGKAIGIHMVVQKISPEQKRLAL